MAIKGQSLIVTLTAIDSTTGKRKTGDAANITPYLVLDGALTAFHATPKTVSEVSAAYAKGSYSVVLENEDALANTIEVGGNSSTPNIEIIPVKIVTEQGRIDAAISTRSSHSAADVKSAVEAAGSSLATIITHLTQIKGAGWATQSLVAIKEFIDSIILKTQNLPAQPAAVGSEMTLPAAYDPAKNAASQSSVNSLAATLALIQGDGFSNQTLVALKTAIDAKLNATSYTQPDNAGIANALAAASTAASNAADAQAAAEAVGLDLDAVKAKTDQLTFTENKVDANANVDVNEQGIADAVIAGINSAGDGKVLLTDTVEYPSGTPLVGVTVTVCTDSAGLVKQESDVTDSLGRFSFYLTPGTYYLSVQHPKYNNELIEKIVTAT